jgi:catechol 2,3-dioxygenase-like lactoylglutathione lyase family enzyme
MRIGLLAAGIVLMVAGASSAQDGTAVSASRPVIGTSYVILRVAELNRSVSFYRDLIGLPLASSNGEIAFFTAGPVTLMIQQVPSPDTPSGGLAAFTEIVLDVRDIEATARLLAARGIQFRTEPRVVNSDGTRKLLAAAFRDPDGYALSIAEWVSR